ncbi:MAG TPA: helix-turn-helix transcriptional regulator [Anaerolineae bacterium]|nr:helix-turn-helix transcriptional regulator [Anaerolineae bacterium]
MDERARIRFMRHMRGVTQAELARLICVPASWISYIETGTFLPTPKQVEAIEKALDWGPADDQALALIRRQQGMEPPA